MSLKKISFNKPYMTGKELAYITEAHSNKMLAGDGPFSKKCHAWIEKNTGTKKALLTHSCTAALEMAALLIDIQPGDEVIMPSYTFVSTANAFVLRGAVPVFVDIRKETLNINEDLIEEAINSRTIAIVPVHYAGVPCEMDSIMSIANKHGLIVIEDAAQGIMSTYKGRALGSIGDLGAYSFHETKNVISGEGGALLVNDPELILRAETIREKGTNRSQFFRGEVDKYTWKEVGSSYLPGELIAAFLWAQLEEAENITKNRLTSWKHYHNALQELENKELIHRPIIPDECQHNAHMYYIIVSSIDERTKLINYLKSKDINTVFHYVPLHSSEARKKYSKTQGSLQVTENISERLVRLPLWTGLTQDEIEHVCESITQFYCEQSFK